MRKLTAVAVLLGLAVCPQVWAQHQHEPTIIDGAKNPELIPNNDMYFVMFNHLTDSNANFQAAAFAELNLNLADRQAIAIIAREFRSAHDSWQARHDSLARYGGTAYNQALLHQQREDLLDAARSNIGRSLSAKGQASVLKYIAKLKAGAKVYTSGGAQ